DNTVIVFMTDNGYSFGEHRWFDTEAYTSKRCPYEECIRTPLLVRVPGAAAHADGHLVTNVDLAPTFAALAGVAPGLSVDGKSLVPLLSGPGTFSGSSVLVEWKGDTGPVTPYRGLRTHDYLYTELATGETELYDLTG